MASPAPRLTVLSLAAIARDGRVLRQLDAAARAGWSVTAVVWGAPADVPAEIALRPVAPHRFGRFGQARQALRLLAGRWSQRAFEAWYWAKPDHRAALAAVVASKPDVIHANDVLALPAAIHAAKRTGARVLFDAHEYSPERLPRRTMLRALARPLYRWLLATYGPRADAMVTVGPALAERYLAEFGLRAGVVRNCPPYQDLPLHATDPGHIRLIHHGVAMPARQLERMIDVVARCDARWHLCFVLLDDGSRHVDALARYAERRAPGRVAFRDPVPPDRIAATLNAEADVGLFLLPPVDFSYRMALPNKLFEFIMAGLAVAIGPSPEMARVVEEHGCGVIGHDFEPASLADRLNRLTEADIDAFKRRSLVAARTLNAEGEMARLVTQYADLLGRAPQPAEPSA